MSGAEQPKRSTTSDWLIFAAVAGLGFAVTLWSALPSSGTGSGPFSLRDAWRQASAASVRVARSAWSSVPKPYAWATDAPEPEVQTHRVRPGDTLSLIARTRGVAIDALVSANAIEDPDRLEVGQAIQIPNETRRPPEPARSRRSGPLEPPRLDSTGFVRRAAGSFARLFEVDSDPWPYWPPRGPMNATVEMATLRTIDELVEIAETELRNAQFQNALEISEAGLRLLGLEDDPGLSDPRRARLELVRATAYTSFGDTQAARMSFGRALESNPKLVLDPADNSPKLVRNFGDACRNAPLNQKLACRDDELLALAEEELLSAHFQDALESSQAGLRLLGLEDDPLRASIRRARFELVSAAAHSAFGDAQAARRSFERALEADPELRLDPAMSSPKLLRAFGDACRTATSKHKLACRTSN